MLFERWWNISTFSKVLFCAFKLSGRDGEGCEYSRRRTTISFVRIRCMMTATTLKSPIFEGQQYSARILPQTVIVPQKQVSREGAIIKRFQKAL